MSPVDYLVVGAGTAGSVLAARLSEDPGRRVLVLEAGPDYPAEASLPAVLRDGDPGPQDGYDWGLTVSVNGRPQRYHRGKVVGGSAQVNQRGAVRAPATDFDQWAGLGLPAWSFPEVLPAYRRLETDEQYGDRPYHGSDGPIPVTRWPDPELTPAMSGLIGAVVASGHPYCPDLNAPDALGIGPYPQNRRGRSRVSSATGYLAPARTRANLTVRGEVTVDRVVVRDGRAVGVEAGGELVEAREVIVCAGAPLSPALLLRSGIGPGDQLREVGVPALVDLPGVGTRLIDQPGMMLWLVPTRGTAAGPQLQVIGRLAGFPGHPADLAFYLCLFGGMVLAQGPAAELATAIGAPVAHGLMIGDMRAAARGRVRLAGPDAAAPPLVELPFYAGDTDLDRMCAGFRHAWEIVNRRELAAVIDRIALADDALVADDERLREAVRGFTFARTNLLGGCPMGPAGDPFAVVDQDCRVRGVAGLRVVDASIIPVALRAPAALTCMMLGEHAAVRIAGNGYGAGRSRRSELR